MTRETVWERPVDVVIVEQEELQKRVEQSQREEKEANKHLGWFLFFFYIF